MDITDAEMSRAKDKKVQQMRDGFQKLLQTNAHLSRYSKWMSGSLNNAQLGAISLYRELVPVFIQLFIVCEENFENFYLKAEAISKTNIDDRLTELQKNQSCS